jgi:ribosomal protein S18 acetylase RimI-like enzyme
VHGVAMTSLTNTETGRTTRTVAVRDATADDAEFLAWVMLTAARSHLPRGIWDYLLGWNESRVLEFLAALSQRDPVHLFHWSKFVVAEVDGQRAAALSGYDADKEGLDVYLPIAVALYLELGAADADLDALMARGADLQSAMEPPLPRAWVVENVATAPAFRRTGLSDQLLEKILERGRSAGYTTAQISVFIGNDPARAAYIKHGFSPEGETRAAAWEAAMSCPGIERLVQPL